MSHACGRFIGEEVTGGCLEELHHSSVLPGRGVGYIDHHGSAVQRVRESFACESVDPGRGRRGYCFMSMLTKLIDKLRSNESSAADYYDFHNLSFLFDRARRTCPSYL